MTIALPTWLGPLVLLLVCSAALLKGGFEERLTAGALLTSVGVTVLFRDHSWSHLQLAGFAMDVLVLTLFVAIALRSPKYWPMAAAGFQLLAVLTHIAKMMDPNLQQWAYITAIVIWTYLVIIALAIGVCNAWRARRQPATAAAPRTPARR